MTVVVSLGAVVVVFGLVFDVRHWLASRAHDSPQEDAPTQAPAPVASGALPSRPGAGVRCRPSPAGHPETVSASGGPRCRLAGTLRPQRASAAGHGGAPGAVGRAAARRSSAPRVP